MRYDPATGAERPYPSHAEQWREWHGYATAWLFNPWTGDRRDARDVGSDVLGRVILPPGEAMKAEAAAQSMVTGSIPGLREEMNRQRASRITPLPHA
jgi:hypothetical protein